MLISAQPAAHGPPPLPPPIYAEKTKGSKKAQGATLLVRIQRCAALAPQHAEEGAILWLCGPSGTWLECIVPPAAFADEGADEVELLVATTLDPVAILLQPQRQAWAQQVVALGLHDATCDALVSASP